MSSDFSPVAASATFFEDLHGLLVKCCAAWPQERTIALIGVMTRWNAEPSCARAVHYAGDSLGVSRPSCDTVELRHNFAHGYRRAISKAELDRAWPEIDDIVALLLLRLLGFDGLVYLGHSREKRAMTTIAAGDFAARA